MQLERSLATIAIKVAMAPLMTAELILTPVNTAPNFETGSIFFVGNATVILRYGGFTVLTDPNFLHQGDHAHLGYGLKSLRLTANCLVNLLSSNQAPALIK